MRLARKEMRRIVGCFLTVFILVFLFLYGIYSHSGEGKIYELPRGWRVKIGDKTYENIPLEDVSDVLEDEKKRDVITLSHPLYLNTHDPLTLRVYSRLSAIKVIVDDRQIYSYGFANITDNKMVGSGYHFVLIPSSYYGRILTIELTASEDEAVTSAPEIVFTRADEAISIFAKDRIFGIFSGLFMVLSGMVLIVLSILAIYMDNRFYPLIVIGIFSFAAGVWCLATIKALQLFSGDITLNSILEYLSMYLLPVPALFLSAHFRLSASPRTRKFILIITSLSGIYFLTALFLQIFNILDVTRIVSIYHFMLVPVVMSLLFAGSAKWRRMKSPERMFQSGLYLITAMVVLEISAYYVISMFYSITMQINTIVTPLAMLTLNVVMTIGFLLEIYDMRLKDTERERLQRLAFRDQMTGLMNRSMCEKRFMELKESGEDFVILDMDLNGLKAVNDHYGHLMGDEYIKAFSDIVKKAFGGEKDLYRVGGDEFLYISTEMSWDELYRKVGFMKKLEKIMEKENGYLFSIDASYGLADSRQTEYKDPENVYRMADQKMYEMKRDLKKERR